MNHYRIIQRIIAIVLLLIWMPVSSHAKQAKYISLDLRNIEVTDALKFLAVKAGLNIIPTKEVSGRITLMVEDVPVQDVFDIMLRSNSLAYEKQGDIYNVMTEKEYKARYGKNSSDIRQVHVFRLRYAVPEQAYSLSQTLLSDIGKVLVDADSGTLLVMDTPAKIKDIEQALNTMEEKGIIRMFNLKYARAEDIEKQLKQQLEDKKVGSIKADERTNQVIVQTLPERMEDIEQLIQGLDQKTREVLIDAKIIQIRLSDNISSGVEWEGLFDLGGESGLSYIGSYPFSAVQSSTADWASRKATYANVGYVGSYPSSGTTAYSSDTTIASYGKQAIASEEIHLGMVDDDYDFDTIIKYLQTLGETRILSNPKLAVVNNQEAKIHVGQLQKYVITTTTQGEATQTISEDIKDLEVGTRLFITPTINEEGFITIDIKPEITSVTSYLETSQGNRIPIVEIATAETVAMVKDGTSVLIGGLSQEEKKIISEGVPLLSKLPFIGNIFKSSSTTTTRNELLVIITPHIISGDELTTGYARDFSLRLDKEYQDYRPFAEGAGEVGLKGYQGYPSLEKTEPLLQLKPTRDF